MIYQARFLIGSLYFGIPPPHNQTLSLYTDVGFVQVLKTLSTYKVVWSLGCLPTSCDNSAPSPSKHLRITSGCRPRKRIDLRLYWISEWSKDNLASIARRRIKNFGATKNQIIGTRLDRLFGISTIVYLPSSFPSYIFNCSLNHCVGAGSDFYGHLHAGTKGRAYNLSLTGQFK